MFSRQLSRAGAIQCMLPPQVRLAKQVADLVIETQEQERQHPAFAGVDLSTCKRLECADRTVTRYDGSGTIEVVWKAGHPKEFTVEVYSQEDDFLLSIDYVTRHEDEGKRIEFDRSGGGEVTYSMPHEQEGKKDYLRSDGTVWLEEYHPPHWNAGQATLYETDTTMVKRIRYQNPHPMSSGFSVYTPYMFSKGSSQVIAEAVVWGSLRCASGKYTEEVWKRRWDVMKMTVSIGECTDTDLTISGVHILDICGEMGDSALLRLREASLQFEETTMKEHLVYHRKILRILRPPCHVWNVFMVKENGEGHLYVKREMIYDTSAISKHFKDMCVGTGCALLPAKRSLQ